MSLTTKKSTTKKRCTQSARVLIMEDTGRPRIQLIYPDNTRVFMFADEFASYIRGGFEGSVVPGKN